MNQCANARAASLERCKRMLASPLFLPGFLLVLHSPPPFPFSLSNCCLSLTHTIAANAAVFTFHFSLTNSFFSSHSFFGLRHPSPVLPSYLFISILCSFHPKNPPTPLARTGTRWCHHFYFLPPCSRSSPQLSILSPIVFKESGIRQKKCVRKGGGRKKEVRKER